jgi:hypothetical protein
MAQPKALLGQTFLSLCTINLPVRHIGQTANHTHVHQMGLEQAISGGLWYTKNHSRPA